MSARAEDTSAHDGVIEKIKESSPCRGRQINTLVSLFGALLHVEVDCVECFTSSLLYEHVLNQLTGAPPCAENEYVTKLKCDNMNDFVRMLRRVVEDQSCSHETLHMIFHRAERLRDMDINILPALLRLQQLSGLNLTVILESEIVWDKFRCGTGFLEPFQLHFPDYSKENLIEIMSEDEPIHGREFYCTYLNLLLSVFHHACRNLSELRHLAQLNFPKYLEPIKSGECDPQDFRKLWRNIEPHLKKALQTVYLREVSSAQWERMQQENAESSSQAAVQGSSMRSNIELPFYSKYLLIAAYCASYNPMKTDKRFFSKHSAKVSRRANLASIKKNERTSAQLLGPKPFPLDRLMAIFYSLVDDKVTPTANIFSQVTSLVSLGLLTQIISADSLECPKYKCLVNLDFMKILARSVNIDIIRYLYDFV